MKSKKGSGVLSDKPLTDPELDRFGYKNFSEHLAKSILSMDAVEGLVLALYGPWGSGKTTAINFILHYLSQASNGERPIIIKYNPWWFSGDESLIRHFFHQLRVTLKKELVLEEEQRKVFSELIDMIADAWDDLPWQAKIALKIMGKGRTPPNIVELKEQVADILREQNKKIIVVIDDIDRLNPEEIRQIFKLVKAVADFPNIIYILSFDKTIAFSSLETATAIKGEEYLEKIIQAPFEVPLPERSQINDLVIEKLNSIFKEETGIDQSYWQNVYFDGVERFITTPRKVIQLFNALSVTFPVVKGEVNAIDFTAIESIRIFSPKAYDIIRKNPKQFTGERISGYGSDTSEKSELKQFHDGWMSSLPEGEQKILSHLLPVLFPKLHPVFGGYMEDSGDMTKWRKLNRVCHPEIFQTYFRLSLSEKTVSVGEIQALIKLSANQKFFSSKLLQYTQEKYTDKTTRLRYVLDRFRDYVDDEKLPDVNKQNVVNSLFEVGDQLTAEDDANLGMFDITNDRRIGMILWRLLDKKDKKGNFEKLRKAIRNGKSLRVMVREMTALGQQHGKYGGSIDLPDSQLLTKEHQEELEHLAAGVIKKAADKKTLINSKGLISILKCWNNWSTGDPAGKWVLQFIENDEGLIKLLTQFVGYGVSFSSSGTNRYPRLDPKTLTLFLKDKEVEGVIERVRKLLKEKSISPEQKVALDQLLKEHQMRKAGKDPDNPLADLI